LRYLTANKLNSIHITRCDNLSCVTHFDFTDCHSLYSGHLEQLAIACSNLQRSNLQKFYHCLESLQGLQAIASHCCNLQGLNLVNAAFHGAFLENVISSWKILSGMKLTHLAVDFIVFIRRDADKEELICLYQKCLSVRGIDSCQIGITIDMLSYFPLMNYCHVSSNCSRLTPTFRNRSHIIIIIQYSSTVHRDHEVLGFLAPKITPK